MSGRVLVTGAAGFIGHDLVVRLAAAGWQVRAAARDIAGVPAATGIERVVLPDLAGAPDWGPLVAGISHVVHLAGIAHARAPIPEATYHRVNAAAVDSLAWAAATAGVHRVLMLSSVKAQCADAASIPLTEVMTPAPDGPYGRSKLEGERLLAARLATGSTDWAVLRPVLVYGPGVKANMSMLARLARSGLLLPLGALTGRRSLLGLANLGDAVMHVLTAQPASRKVMLVADPGPLAVPEMIAAMRAGLGRSPGLIKVPLAPARIAARLVGRAAMWDRIAGTLVVETTALEATGWRPQETAADGLARWMRDDKDRA